MPEAIAACAANAFMDSMVLRHWTPERAITDWGRCFTAEMMEEPFQLTNTNHACTTAYNSQTNRLSERINRTLATMITKYVSAYHRDWDQSVQYVVFVYNSLVHETTGHSTFPSSWQGANPGTRTSETTSKRSQGLLYHP